MLRIRPVAENEAALIARISRETFVDTFAAENTTTNMEKFLTEQFSTEMLVQEVGQPGHIFFLAMMGETPAGYLFLKDIQTDETIEISRIYVHRSFIGGGVGKMLMQTAIQFAKKENKKTVWLGVWKRNHRAIRFYESFGFKKFSEHDFILGDDVQLDWLMQLHL
jgi:ribosomal protein S18 acetylase RimI-like enzyme